MEQVTIYLAGGVKKIHTQIDTRVLFDDDSKEQLLKALEGYDLVILDPNISDYFQTPYANFGKDMLSVISSNFLIIDLREKRGIGVGAEMMIAKFNSIPVISVCPPHSHYRRQLDDYEWTHPFITALSDGIVNDFSQAALWIKNFLLHPTHVKSQKEINEYIEIYKQQIMNDDKDFLKHFNKIKV